MQGSHRSSSPFDPSDVCDHADDPPPRTLDPVLVDWSELGTTPDQQRIEQALEGLSPRSAATILHVGVGNSGLARRFASRVEAIDGLTVSEREKEHGEALRIENYTVHLVNKYSGALLSTVSRRYDFIVDNNLVSFACCGHHLDRMFEDYSRLLNPAGRVLTDEVGMAWSVGGDPGWAISYDDLEALGQRFGLQAARITDSVFELRRS